MMKRDLMEREFLMHTNVCLIGSTRFEDIFRKLEFKVTPLQTQRIISNDVTGHSLIMIDYHNFKYLIMSKKRKLDRVILLLWWIEMAM